MSSDNVSLIVDLATALVALGIGTRLGYVLSSRGTARDVAMMERHFEASRQLFERQCELQFIADRRSRAREELKKSYVDLGIWLHTLERTIDEINAGAKTSRPHVRNKARGILGDRPWSVISPPAALASSEFYWSSEVRKLVTKLEAPYANFISRVSSIIRRQSTDEESAENFDQQAWGLRNELISIIHEIKTQARADLMQDGM
ncbi:hypothetical protein [Streptomyces sp. NPDC020917]|uniref:hypothetical protein n=1 Tax=Streptomyces sp. NPDC020917 TaxID=3365102 RepID=UPI003794394D